MGFNKLYIDWIKYLKQRKLYEDYRIAYSSVSYYLYQRDRALTDGSYWNRSDLQSISVLRNAIQHYDPLIPDKGGGFDFFTLQGAMNSVDYNLAFYSSPTVYNKFRKVIWLDIVKDFGELKGLYKRPTRENLFNDSSTIVSSTGLNENSWTISMDWDEPIPVVRNTVRNNAESRYNRAHEGQWYDRFNGANNRRRNNNFNQNVQWRRR